MLDDLAQAGTDGWKKVIQTQMGDHRVVHFQQKAHAAAILQGVRQKLAIFQVERLSRP